MLSVIEYSDFFRQFAKNHVDIAHKSIADNPLKAPQVTEQGVDRSDRFNTFDADRMSDSLSNNTNAKYKAYMFLWMFEYAPTTRDNNIPPRDFMYTGGVTVIQESEEGNYDQENTKLSICKGIIDDLIQYISQSSVNRDSENCHEFLRMVDVRKMNVIPEFNFLDTNAHGFTLQIHFTEFQSGDIRLGKFRPNFLEGGQFFEQDSPVQFSPSSEAPGGTVTISLPSIDLSSTSEVRLYKTTDTEFTQAIRLPKGTGAGTFLYNVPNLEATLPTSITSGDYYIEIYTDNGSWISTDLLTVT